MNCSIHHLSLFAFLAACATLDPDEIEARREAELPAIYETVFRYQFEHNASAQQQNVDYYFLSITPPSATVVVDLEDVEEVDREALFAGEFDPPPGYYEPSAEFMTRFEGHSPRVEPRSMAADSGTDRVRHKNGGSGLSFGVYAVRWIDDSTLEVDGGYHESGRSGSTNIYRVERVDGVWAVTEDIMIEIS